MPKSFNIAEGWHLGFKSLVQCTNPTRWTFFDALNLEQGLTEQKITDWLMLRAPEPRANKWIEVDQKMEEKMAFDNDRYELSSNSACRNIVLSQYSVLIVRVSGGAKVWVKSRIIS